MALTLSLSVLATASNGVGQGDFRTLDRPGPAEGTIRGLLITGGHEHGVAFYSLFPENSEFDRLVVDTAANAFKADLRDKYDVVIMYDFTRDLDENARNNLRAFVESGKGIVVLHHALLDYQTWSWWSESVVGGRYRLQPEGTHPSSSAKDNQDLEVTPVGDHPILRGVGSFHVHDEPYKNQFQASGIMPLLVTDHPASDRVLAWIGPTETYRVVAIQVGHGPSVFQHPSYRALVHNAILWAAGRTP
jgi:type 1 glutamine amidotransferase